MIKPSVFARYITTFFSNKMEFIDFRTYKTKETQDYLTHISYSKEYANIMDDYNNLMIVPIKESLVKSKEDDPTENIVSKKWCINVLEFAKFLVDAEKKFLYLNDDTKLIYSESYKNINNIFFDLGDHKVKISITPNKLQANTSTTLEEYLAGDDDTNKNNPLVFNIEIKREIGSELQNSVRIELADGVAYVVDRNSSYLIDILTRQTSNLMIEVFNNVINNIFSKYTGIEIVDWKGFLKDGIWVPRYTTKK